VRKEREVIVVSTGRIFEFRGYIADPSGVRDLLLWIEAPLRMAKSEEFYCQIGGSVFSRPMKIYGEDAEQAKALAHSVIKRRLNGKTLLDSNGAPIEFPSLSSERS